MPIDVSNKIPNFRSENIESLREIHPGMIGLMKPGGGLDLTPSNEHDNFAASGLRSTGLFGMVASPGFHFFKTGSNIGEDSYGQTNRNLHLSGR